jgi:hypothetical protein
MKPSFAVACVSLKSAWQAVLPRTALIALLLAPLAIHAQFSAGNVNPEALPEAVAGFEATMFAREPVLRNPCSIAFDSQGRLFVGMGPQYRNPTPQTPPEKNGGVITSSAGLETAKNTWGQHAEWCDYSGTTDGIRVGAKIIPDPANFRPSWWHNRDYGVFVANPFGRAAMKQGAECRVEVKKGETFRMRFSVVFHQAKE